MKIVLVAIDTKYIHTNMALRYLKANCRYDCQLLEFTIKDSLTVIYDTILAVMPDVVAFSVYLWNVSIVLEIAKKLKAVGHPVIVAGGPEVGYDPKYYLDTSVLDFIVAGEGEVAFDALMKALETGSPVSEIPNLVYREGGKIQRHALTVIHHLDDLKNPYRFSEDLPHLAHKIQYLELSRGCPYHCSYCLASLENQVRFYSVQRVKDELLYLMDHGAKIFKFLDRTFNLKPAEALDIFRFIIENHQPNTVFQFEITGDILPREIILYINAHAPKHLIRFEIGIQSTDEQANLAVDRRQNNETLFDNIRLIREGGIIDLHLDLIAGLPGEDLKRFERTFNEVFALEAKELQLGFLKLLRGTKIRNEAAKYGYRYQEKPPYEILQNDVLSPNDLIEIHLVEEALKLYWNKGFTPQTIRGLMKKSPSPFIFFNQIGHFYQQCGYSFHRYEYSELFNRLAEFVKWSHPELYSSAVDDLKYEYLSSCNIKSKIWWNNDTEKCRKTALLRDFYATDSSVPLHVLSKHAVVTEYQGKHLLALYLPHTKIIRIF